MWVFYHWVGFNEFTFLQVSKLWENYNFFVKCNIFAFVDQKARNMAIFYRVVRNLVDFSLVTKLTKHVSKVRETVKKVRKNTSKWLRNVFYDIRLAKNDIAIFGFLFLYKIPDFTTRLVPWPGDKNSPHA